MILTKTGEQERSHARSFHVSFPWHGSLWKEMKTQRNRETCLHSCLVLEEWCRLRTMGEGSNLEKLIRAC